MALGWLHLARCAGMCLCWGRGRGGGGASGDTEETGEGWGAPWSQDGMRDGDTQVLGLLHSNTGVGGERGHTGIHTCVLSRVQLTPTPTHTHQG